MWLRVQPDQELLRKWEIRAGFGRFHSHLEIGRDGLVLGAGTLLTKSKSDPRGRPCLVLDEPLVTLLLAIAYGQPSEAYALEKICRAVELWNEGEKALAHIHLSYAGLPACGDDAALGLFLAEECLAAGVTPAELMKRLGFDLPLARYSPDQPRVPAGSGRESGRWTDGGGTSISYADERSASSRENRSTSANPRTRPTVVTAGVDFKQLGSLIQSLVDLWSRVGSKGKVPSGTATKPAPVPTLKPPTREGSTVPSVKPFRSLEEDLPRPGTGKEVSVPGLPDTVKGIDATNSRAGMPNYEVNLSRQDFESKLSQRVLI